MHRYVRTAAMSCLEKLNGGALQLLPDLVIKVFTLVPQVFLWRGVMLSGVKTDLTLPQMLTYTYLSTLLADMMVVQSSASGWLYEGVLMRLYGRPMSVLGQLAAQTAGGWIPALALFSMPMALVAPLFGVSLKPATHLFWMSLALCVSLGFAVDVLFACLAIKMRGINWLVSRVRHAITALLSGTIIPIQLLPGGVKALLRLQPFASLGGAPLSLFVGVSNAADTLPLQLFWNLLLWPIALIIFRKSEEGLVSYGG